MPPSSRPTLIIVSGLSGSGKSVALRTLEDQDYYCVDNLPAELLTDFVRNMSQAASPRARLAVGIDVRNVSSDLSRMGEWLSAVAARFIFPETLFLIGSLLVIFYVLDTWHYKREGVTKADPTPDTQGFGIEVDLAVSIPGMARADAEALVQAAHGVCPYSNATRGNIEVRLSVV